MKALRSTSKSTWQLGTADFKCAVEAVFAKPKIMDYARIQARSLFFMSEGEAPELKRQSLEIYTDFCQRGVDVTLREFTAAEGADGRCQVNNLRLAHWLIFDRLGRVFGNEPGDVRLRC